MIAERTRDKIAASRRKGKWTGGRVPFGYSAKDKKLVVTEVEARVVREAFALFLQHRQMAKVARELNERGLLPRGSSRPSRLGLRWTKDSIARVLRSPLYAGLMMYGDELHPGEQPRIIDDATYRQATRILEDERRELRFTGLNPDYVLRGLLRCTQCGQAMCPGSTSKNGKTYHFYRCSMRDKPGKDACSARPLPARALEELVAERITAATADVKLVQHIERSLRARIEAQRASLAAIRADLPGRVASASAAASKLADELGKLDGRARELVEAKLRVEADRLVAAERQLAETERDLADLEVADAEATWMLGARREDGLWPAARHPRQVLAIEHGPDFGLLVGGHLRGSSADRYRCRMLMGLFSHLKGLMPSVRTGRGLRGPVPPGDLPPWRPPDL